MEKEIKEILSKFRGNQGYTMDHTVNDLNTLFLKNLSLVKSRKRSSKLIRDNGET